MIGARQWLISPTTAGSRTCGRFHAPNLRSMLLRHSNADHPRGNACFSTGAISAQSSGGNPKITRFEELLSRHSKTSADEVRHAADLLKKKQKTVAVSSFGGVTHKETSAAAPKGQILVDSSLIDPSWRIVQALKAFPSAPEGDPFVAAKVGDRIVGLGEPLLDSLIGTNTNNNDEGELRIELLSFSSLEGKKVFWHSAAHVLGASLEAELGSHVQLCDGPPLVSAEGGFFYESHITPPSSSMKPPASSLLSLVSPSRGGGSLTDSAIPILEKRMKQLTKEKAPFQRCAVTIDEALELFRDNPFKVQMLEGIPKGEQITLYRCGAFVDMCRGPHVPHTGLFKALQLYRIAGSHWNGAIPRGYTSHDNSNSPPLLQRVYGIAFPSNQGLAEWREGIEEAKRRDHRVIGKAQQLFFFHEMSPGSAFFLPHGTRIYNRLVSLLRDEYRRRGYEEVMSPLLYKRELWATSGHLQAYSDAMFSVKPGIEPMQQQQQATGHDHDHKHGEKCCPKPAEGTATAANKEAQVEEEEVFGLKPMNCPGHCLIFKHRAVSYRELPMRLADFSSLHRNEATGALGGLTRLRRFQQDDAHIFCTLEQVADEVAGCLSFIAHIYRIFGFSFRAKLSTRPETYVGDIETWNSAEKALGDSLRRFLVKDNQQAGDEGKQEDTAAAPAFEVDVGGGAFYGPKIDVFVRDAIGREHQCATVQLDFNLPRRFELKYADDSAAPVTPVMIHRAILGSVERMLGILIEHTGGKWPFWLSPRQVMVCSVSDRNSAYAQQVAAALMRDDSNNPSGAANNNGSISSGGNSISSSFSPDASSSSLYVDVDSSSRTIPKKVREAQVGQYNVIAVVGDAEQRDGTVTLRFRDQATWDAFSSVAAKKGVTLAVDQAAAAPAEPAEGNNNKQPQQPQQAALPNVTLPVEQVKSLCTAMAAELL